jgi:hypothetical protein
MVWRNTRLTSSVTPSRNFSKPPPKNWGMLPSREPREMSHVHLVKGTTETGEPVEEFFFTEDLAEWECAAYEVAERPHEKIKMTIEEAIEKYGIYFMVVWTDPSGYHEEVWREFSRAEERHGDLLFDLPDFFDPVWQNNVAAEIYPRSPKQINQESVRDLH